MPIATRLKCLLPVLLISAALTAVTPVFAPPASATSTYHCSGYQPCADLGMGSSGYASRSNKMYWRMYSGHNCTNYVAYRMIQAGMSTERPWSGSGNASNWGVQMSSITDKTPQVGAVAWWKAGVAGAGSSGHVAYVEKVVSATEIVISEDSYHGTFHWRTIVNNGPGWPSGFIHFVDKQIASVQAPRVLGTPQVGNSLTARPGTWKPGGATKGYQWLADGAPIPGATSDTFALTPAQQGAQVTVQVSAAKKGYATAVVNAAPIGAVAPGDLASVTPPTLAGTGEVGQVLTATRGSWSPKPSVAQFKWKADGRRIAGAKGPSLTLTDALVGKTITLEEKAVLKGYTTASAPAPVEVGPVVEGAVEVTEPFAAAGRNRYGETLSIAPGRVSPLDAKVTYTWLRDGAAVAGANGTTYTLGRDDIGHELSAQIAVSKRHWRGLVRNFAFATTTTPTATSLKVKTSKQKMAIVAVRVRAGGLGAVDGPVSVVVGSRRAHGKAVNGFVRIAVKNLSPGWHRMEVTYLGSPVVESSRAALKVKIKNGKPKKKP